MHWIAPSEKDPVIRRALIEADFGPEHADTFRRDLHPDLRADTATRVSAKPKPRSHSAGLLRSERQLLANPPFNDSDTALRGSAFLQTGGTLQVMAERQDNFRKDDDVRWQFGVPPKGNANFAWVQHFIHHFAPQGMAGFVLANGSMSSNQSGDCNARSARRNWATNSQGLVSQRDIRRAVDVTVAAGATCFTRSKLRLNK